jgi:hypothetical protein
MALNFPNTPTLNQTYTDAGTTWAWNGIAWDLVESPIDYNNLINKPSIPGAQVQSDWNAVSGLGRILNKPAFAAVAISGQYADLSGKPAAYSLPTASTLIKGGVKVDGSTITIDGNGVISSVQSGLQSHTINGVPFNATQDITITADAGTLTGTALNSTIVTSSLTSVGTLGNLTVSGTITSSDLVSTTSEITSDLTAGANVIVETPPTIPSHATNKKYVDARSVAMSIALS